MSVLIGQHTSNTKLIYQGSSTEVEEETMPVLAEINNGSIFEVIDTGNIHTSYSSNIIKN